jgi:hypothetical protein
MNPTRPTAIHMGDMRMVDATSSACIPMPAAPVRSGNAPLSCAPAAASTLSVPHEMCHARIR